MVQPKKNKKTGNLLLNFSPWILAVACTLLLLLLSLFALSNYQREKELMVEALAQKGLTLMRFINSTVRESMWGNLRGSEEWVHWKDHMLAAMEQAVEQPGVEYVLLMDPSGRILSGAGKNLPEKVVDRVSLDFASKLEHGKTRPFVTRISRSVESEKRKFQIASWYMPPKIATRMHGNLDDKPRRGMMRRFQHHPEVEKIQEGMKKVFRLKPIYIIQLDFEQFNSPLKRQFLQIVILLLVIFLVGLGGTLSYMTLKGLRGSQQQLGEMQAFTDILISSLPVGLIATDSDGVVRVYNEAARQIVDIEKNKVVDRMPDICLPASMAQMFSGYVGQEQTEKLVEIGLQMGTQKIKTLQLASMVVMDDHDGFAGEVLLIRDLTEVKHLEKELRRNERLAALGKMAAGVAHELRNPLSSIKGLAVLLKSSLLEVGKDSDSADILVKEVDRLNRSIGELLDYAKPEKLKKKPEVIEDIIQKTVSLVEVDAEAYGVTISVSMSDALPRVSADKDKLNQVLLNLFLNAIQAMPEGGELVIRTEKSGPTVVITVKDNGVGIELDNLSKIFDPYYTTKSDGTGLGLSMSAKIVEEHGGKLEISSEAGVYTEARITLPG